MVLPALRMLPADWTWRTRRMWWWWRRCQRRTASMASRLQWKASTARCTAFSLKNLPGYVSLKPHTFPVLLTMVCGENWQMENTIVGLFFESCTLRNSVTTQTQEAAERERLFNSIETVPGNVPAVKKADWAVGSGHSSGAPTTKCHMPRGWSPSLEGGLMLMLSLNQKYYSSNTQIWIPFFRGCTHTLPVWGSATYWTSPVRSVWTKVGRDRVPEGGFACSPHWHEHFIEQPSQSIKFVSNRGSWTVNKWAQNSSCMHIIASETCDHLTNVVGQINVILWSEFHIPWTFKCSRIYIPSSTWNTPISLRTPHLDLLGLFWDHFGTVGPWDHLGPSPEFPL